MSETLEQQKKKLSKEVLTNQITESKRQIELTQQQIVACKAHIDRQEGVLGYAQHLLGQFDIADGDKKPELEVS